VRDQIHTKVGEARLDLLTKKYLENAAQPGLIEWKRDDLKDVRSASRQVTAPPP
jgi:hypothetical protein